MKEIKPDKEFLDWEDTFYDPMSYDGVTMRCCCGYELLKQDENTFRCAGGNHKFCVQDGTIAHDKYGNILIAKPKPEEKENEN